MRVRIGWPFGTLATLVIGYGAAAAIVVPSRPAPTTEAASVATPTAQVAAPMELDRLNAATSGSSPPSAPRQMPPPLRGSQGPPDEDDEWDHMTDEELLAVVDGLDDVDSPCGPGRLFETPKEYISFLRAVRKEDRQRRASRNCR
ncbi:MAG: hypothetical protein U1E39_13805 [Planctomycetota bacterium]